MRNLGLYLLSIAGIMSVYSCADDDDEGATYPSLHTELAEVYTGSDKNVKTIVFDDGTTYSVSQVISSTTADTVFRCLCSYNIDDNNSAESFKIYQIGSVPSSFPKSYDSFKSHESAPHKVISQWETDRYINAYISYKTTDNGEHHFSFCEDGITTDSEGHTTAHVSMIHTQPENDYESYSKRIYVSFPKYFYEGKTDKVIVKF